MTESQLQQGGFVDLSEKTAIIFSDEYEVRKMKIAKFFAVIFAVIGVFLLLGSFWGGFFRGSFCLGS